MSAYREEDESVRRRIAAVETELTRRRRVWPALALLAIAVSAVANGASLVASRAHASMPPPPEPVKRPPASVGGLAPGEDPCAVPGVHVTVDGREAFAPARTDRDRGGEKYRRGGARATWLTVNGPLYVHAWGSDTPRDLGTTKLTMLDLVTEGEKGGYVLAPGGRAVLEVTRADTHVAGTFEADVARVEEVTHEVPFGTPVVRARGTFCLARVTPNPSDTGP